MLKVRIIPTLLYKDIGLVKGKQFNSKRRVGSVLPAIKVYNLRDVDEMILLDIMATNNVSSPEFESVMDFSSECFVPLSIGGGIKTIEDVKQLLRSGADKIAINTEAVLNPILIKEIASYFGSQCVIVSIDSKKDEMGNYFVYTHSGSIKTNLLVSDWAREVERLGAGEIMITSIDNDGMMIGYDIELTKLVTSAVDIPVIASGGAGKLEDFYEVLVTGGASAAAAASIFHFSEITPKEIKDYLKSMGLNVRNSEIS